MEIFENNNYYKKDQNVKTVLALGNFDGVHTGHCKMLNEAKKYAVENGLCFGVYTFIDSPKFRHQNHSLLTDLQGRLSLIAHNANPDFVYLEKFDDVKDFEPAEFIEYIISKFDAAVCFCGDNFSFGRNASGDSKSLVQLMKSKGRNAVVVPTLMNDSEPVSSTRIRALIETGHVEKARELLGTAFGFTTKVIHGAHLGHTLGFPTVNQIIPKALAVPKYGVYATLVIVDGKQYFGVTNFGVKPTVSCDNTPVAETYIIGFDGNAYDKFVGIYFYKMLREEKKFSSLDELKRSISDNVEQTLEFFNEDMYKNE